jgi:hypothetical protein
MVNADGSDLCQLLFIGQYCNPRCFEKRSAAALGFIYFANLKAWMTAIIFQQ